MKTEQQQFADTLLDSYYAERLQALRTDALLGAFEVEPHGEIFAVVGMASGFCYDIYSQPSVAQRCATLMTLAAS